MTIGRIPSVEGGIQPTIVDAKGDILTATAADTPAVLTVGSNGETLVADSSTSTGLRWQGNFAAGKNKIINGDFRINQRAFTSNTTDQTYNFDRWLQFNSGGTVTVTPQTFTLGAAPVSGYEGTNFVQIAVSGQSGTNYAAFGQRIESVRIFAGQTVTVSFWAKATSGTPALSIELQQYFGSGGSSQVNTSASAATTLSTSWTRYSTTISLPSISGKTISGTDWLQLMFWLSAGSSLTSRTNSIGIQNSTFQIWGVQIEAGSTATAFETATGTLAGELAACQRYYYLAASGSGQLIGNGLYVSATQFSCLVPLPVTMRGTPTLSVVTGSNYYDTYNGASDLLDSLTIFGAGTKVCGLYNNTEAAGTQYRPAYLETNNAAAFVAFSAEL